MSWRSGVWPGLILGLLPSSILQAAPAHEGCAQSPCVETVYIGTHGSGPGQGIFYAQLDPTTGKLGSLELVAEVDRPTWLARDPRRLVLYAVSETGNDGKSQGGVYSLGIDPASGKLHIIGHTQSGGGGATNLNYDPRSETVFVANYGTGQVSAVPVEASGGLSNVSSVQTDIGSGPSRRQAGPHAHGVVLDPSGHFLLAADLGADRVFIYRFDPRTRTLTPNNPPFAQLPAGSGPRHLAFTPNGRFVFLDTELSGEVYSFRWNAQASRLIQASKIALDPPGFAGTRSAAELAVSHDGRFLYVSNRATSTVQVYAIDRQTAALTLVQTIPGGGLVPWSFGIDPTGKWMIVANQQSGNLAEFSIDRRTGLLSATGQRLAVPNEPVAITFSR